MIQISVIIPVYNAEKYIDECMESVANQSLKAIEVIMIDDGSSDNSLALCKKFSKKDNRFIVVHQENKGPSATRNIGLDLAKGKYVAFIDADDTMDSEMLEKMLEEAESSHADIVMCNYKSIVQEHIDYIFKSNIKQGVIEGNNKIKNILLQRYYQGNYDGLTSVWNKIYRLEYLKNNKIRFNENLSRAEDFWFNFNVLENAKCFSLLEEAYYNYRQINPQSIMRTVSDKQYENWKYNLITLLEKNKDLKFQIDYEKLYFDFNYKVFYYILDLIEIKEDIVKVYEIWNDNFYQNAITYTSKKVKFRYINKIISKKRYILAYNMCKLLNRIRKCKR